MINLKNIQILKIKYHNYYKNQQTMYKLMDIEQLLLIEKRNL